LLVAWRHFLSVATNNDKATLQPALHRHATINNDRTIHDKRLTNTTAAPRKPSSTARHHVCHQQQRPRPVDGPPIAAPHIRSQSHIPTLKRQNAILGAALRDEKEPRGIGNGSCPGLPQRGQKALEGCTTIDMSGHYLGALYQR
jgi:hypothetical protein